MIDLGTGSILLSKHADEQMHPASMSKLMTVYMLLERLKDGRLKLTDEFPISEKAWKMQGSKMYVEVGKRVSIHDLLRGIIVQSGNDACIVVAEGIAGSEAAFAEAMNKKAKELGLTNSHFANASGWPNPNHLMSAHDLATLATDIIQRFPKYYELFSEKSFTYSNIRQSNRNPLLYKNLGVDGLKTGHTEASGYGLVASGVRNGRRLLLVVNGLNSVNERARESERLINWGFREFTDLDLYKAGQQVALANVWLGASETVPLVVNKAVITSIAQARKKQLKLTVHYRGPIPAPIRKGTEIASLTIDAPGVTPREVPLYAGADVAKLGPMGRIFAAIKFLIFGPKV